MSHMLIHIRPPNTQQRGGRLAAIVLSYLCSLALLTCSQILLLLTVFNTLFDIPSFPQVLYFGSFSLTFSHLR